MTIPMIIDSKVQPIVRVTLARRVVILEENVELTVIEEEVIVLTVEDG